MAEAYGEGERESEVISSYPGSVLVVGSKGNSVKLIQDYLNLIRSKYPSIIYLIPDGIYGLNTSSAISEFQKNSNLPVTGKVDEATWNAVISTYNDIKSSTS
ncbi:hypothetical protein SDC9_60222 [bioreactor metagenome]|uniref:Peptidoglycan binding-like domain-containing protein n=1 Tax=bioreactor metagenome TaxID=1076179 RepID=A0A644XCE9_9ZZZZ